MQSGHEHRPLLATVLFRRVARDPDFELWSAADARGFCGNAVVALLFASSGLLFRKAARAVAPSGGGQT